MSPIFVIGIVQMRGGLSRVITIEVDMQRRRFLQGLGSLVLIGPALVAAIPSRYSRCSYEVRVDGRLLGYFTGFSMSRDRTQITMTNGYGVQDWVLSWVRSRERLDLVVEEDEGRGVMQTINCFGCFPVDLIQGDHPTASDLKVLSLTCNVDRIEVA